MIKPKILLLTAAIFLSAEGAKAQVQNYALQFQKDGYVDCGCIPELNGKKSYSLQFFMNPDTWTDGAAILSAGRNFMVEMTKTNTLRFVIGSSSLVINSKELRVGQWAQVTLVVDNGYAKALVNNIEVASGTLDAFPDKYLSEIHIGGLYTGKLDEVRIWGDALSSDFDYFYNNTLNKWCPQWNDLLAYYKCDQEQCKDLVDYRSLPFHERAYNFHGVFSATGVSRVAVNDNPLLPYLINGAYTSNERFFDRGITSDQYLLSNDIIILGIQSYPDGHLEYATPCNHGTVVNGGYLASYQGRQGVLQLNGQGAYMNSGKDAFKPLILQPSGRTAGYTFESWVYLDEWTEGAYLFKKENQDGTKGFSISLGDESSREVVVKVDGKRFVNTGKMPVGKWVHFGLSCNQGPYARNTFIFCYDGKSSWANPKLSDKTNQDTPTDFQDLDAYVGYGLKGKLDEVAIWNQKFSSDEIRSHMLNGQPMPVIGKVVTADMMRNGNSYYKFDNPEQVGYDSFSQDEWKRIMETAFAGHRGYDFRISVSSHHGWQNTISDPAKRKRFASDLARLSKGYAGVELDLEWMDSDWQWSIYGLLADEIRAALPKDKTFMISCHAYGAYRFPKEKMHEVDGFTFQQYGPGKTYFVYPNFVESEKRFEQYGFPRNKIMLSYSTTTSGSFDASDRRTGTIITGVRNGFLDPDTYQLTDADVEKMLVNGNYYYFTGAKQVYKRAKYATDHNLQGIFYWDMGNDVSTSNPYNLAKYCSYGLNSNVDSLVQKVDVHHITTGISTVNTGDLTEELSVSVNPVKSTTIVSLTNGAFLRTIGVYATSGENMGIYHTNTPSFELNLTSCPAGMYLLQVRDSHGKKYTKKLIKQ